MRNLKAVAAETGVDLKTVRAVAAALSKEHHPDPELVVLRHPKLPPDQTIQIDRLRVDARLASGWEEVTEPKPHPEPTESDSEDPELPTESASKRRSRKSTEEQ